MPPPAQSVIEPKPGDRLGLLVRQHAETARLMGVDFVPAYRRSPAAVAATPAVAPEPATVQPAAAPQAPVPATSPPPVATATTAASRRDRADNQRRLDELRERYEREAPHKQFVTAFTKIVFGEGDAAARLMFIGEAPGAEEDKTGRPFVGRAGQLLDKMIEAMGLRREDVYIANVLKTRPPNNATPTTEECAKCAPFLFQQVEIIRPEVIVTLGLPATRTVLNSDETMSRLRGRWGAFRLSRSGLPGLDPAAAIPVMPTYHPAFLLRSYTRENREKVWSDLQQARDRLGQNPN
ncbi:MAG: uracil-DNA glycosylase [Phycisphaeraceae bacterium]|nr:uracil-DNA glycosylase [Phycisphaeraceae bacterium]